MCRWRHFTFALALGVEAKLDLENSSVLGAMAGFQAIHRASLRCVIRTMRCDLSALSSFQAKRSA
jgi:hypothetical protein